MADFWQQYQGYFVFAALIAAVILAALARRWTNNYISRAQAGAARGATFDKSGHAFIEKAIESLATVVHFDTGPAQAAALLGSAKLPMFWKRAGEYEWLIETAKGDPTPATIAVIERDDEGSRLALIRAQDMTGLTVSEPDWRKLRAVALKVAAAAGVSAFEEQGPTLVRVPQVDLTGMVPANAASALHYWQRPSGGTQLLVVDDGEPGQRARISRWGGLPLLTSDLAWPVCASCGGNMQFVGQVRLLDNASNPGEGFLVYFQCGNVVGGCDPWFANSGGNAVHYVPDSAEARTPPASGLTLMPKVTGFRVEWDPESDYDEIGYDRERAWQNRQPGDATRRFVGRLGGSITSDYRRRGVITPCPTCGQPLTLELQIAEGDTGNASDEGDLYIAGCRAHRYAELSLQQ